MRKFCRLIENEWKKQFRKKGLWVMAILVCVAALGFSLLCNIDRILDSNSYYNYYTLQEECEDMIEHYSSFVNEIDMDGNPTSWAQESQMNVEYHQYLLDIGATWEDWRYTSGIIYDAFYAKYQGDTETYTRLKTISDHSDTMAYYSYQKENSAQSAGDDAELLAISNERWDYCIANNVTPDRSDWRYAHAQALALHRQVILTEERKLSEIGKCDEEKLEEARNSAAIVRYQLENNMEVNPADSMGASALTGISGDSAFWNSFAASADLIAIIGVFVIVIAGSIVANEFSQGTIKFLLINPVKRQKLLMSKYATVLLIGLGLTVLQFAVSFIGSLLFCGDVSQAFLPSVIAEGGVIKTVSPYLQLLGQYLLSAVEVVVMGTLAFAISSLARSAALAIGVSLFAYLGGSLLVSLLQAFEFDWARYLLFANLDFAAIVDGTSLFAHQSLTAAIVIVVLHMVVFLWTAWDGFVRREV